MGYHAFKDDEGKEYGSFEVWQYTGRENPPLTNEAGEALPPGSGKP